MTKLFIDIGNSRLKWVVEDEGDVLGSLYASDYHQHGFRQSLERVWTQMAIPEACFIASVADTGVLAQIQRLIYSLWQITPLLVGHPVSRFAGVENAYPQPERLGVDRWLSLLAAHQDHAENMCIIDCGSAVTLDFLTSEGRHLGGVIAPGIKMMKQSLTKGTAALPQSTFQPTIEIATNTESAIHCGCVMAITGLITESLSKMEQSFRLLFTGGDAPMLTPMFDAPDVDPLLVMRGLQVFCKEQDL